MFVPLFIFSQNKSIWISGTAFTYKKNHVNINLLYKSSFGLNTKLELQSQPFLFIYKPNIGIKYKWLTNKGYISHKFLKSSSYILSSRHELYYATKYLNTFKNINYFNYSPSPDNIKKFFNIENELIFSILMRKNRTCNIQYSILTLKLGNVKSLKKEISSYSIEKNSFWYILTAMNNDKSLWYSSLQYDNKFKYDLFYKIKLDINTIGLGFKNTIIQQQTLAYSYMGKNNKTRIGLGYIISYSFSGINPSIYPIFSLGYTSNFFVRKKNKNLFRNQILNKPEEARDMF